MANRKDLAERMLLILCQGGYGQTVQERLDLINEALNHVGIKAKWCMEKGNPRKQYIDCDNETEGNLAGKFYYDLKKCWPKGEFQAEARCIEGVLREYEKMKEGVG